jgi:hypothetical protein
MTDDQKVACIQAAIQAAGPGATWTLEAIRKESEPGGVLYDEEHGWPNPALTVGMARLVKRHPGQAQAVGFLAPAVGSFSGGGFYGRCATCEAPIESILVEATFAPLPTPEPQTTRCLVEARPCGHRFTRATLCGKTVRFSEPEPL